MNIICRFFIFFCMLITPCNAGAWEARVIRVSDGDTLLVESVLSGKSLERLTIRLHGVDTPECKNSRWPEQPYCSESKEYLAYLLSSGKIVVLDLGKDGYGRSIGGVVSLPDGKVIQEELLLAGLAWVDPRFCRDCRQWKMLQEEARVAKRGLWADDSPVPPWEWRKRDHARALPILIQK